jgi:hypothetical protein
MCEVECLNVYTLLLSYRQGRATHMIQLPKLSPLANPSDAFAELNPIPRMLMGPGPINADPRVLKAMSSHLFGQFDPQFRGFMRETMGL